jgi:choline dehydrogenase
VLLIEAGGEENFLQDIPMLAAVAQFTPANWAYKTEQQPSACLGLVDGQCNWPRGKVLGGTTVLNYMVYTRGSRKDYDGWEQNGCEGWGYDDVLPYFLKHEDMLIPDLANDTTYHSTKGELAITYPRYHTQSATDFIEAGVQIGYQGIDYNGASHIGYSYAQCTIKDGMRLSSNRAFLEPATKRRNLHVLKNSLVTKILIHAGNKTAYGVEYNGFLGIFGRKAYARKEVIVCAGAINSPQLLMLSGIGPKENLEKVGIPVIQDLKVGYNLQDHISLGTLFFTANSTITLRFDNIIEDVLYVTEYLMKRDGVLSAAGSIEALAFEDIVVDDDGNTEIELLFAGTTLASLKPVWVAWGGRNDIYEVYKSLAHKNAFSIFPMLLYPKSRGRLLLRSSDPRDKPLLYHNYLTEKEDVDIMVKAIKRAIELTKAEAFQRHGVELFRVPLPPCKDHEFASDAYWECVVRYMTFSVYHQSGTCKMGPDSDEDAVVDPRLRVRGIKNLRVMDASIMPVIIAGHLTGPVYMIGEKGAAMVKADWNASTGGE